MSLILNPSLESKLKATIKAPPHAVLISGASSEDNYLLALRLARDILGIDDFLDYQYGLVIKSKENKAIGVEDISRLHKFLVLKVAYRKKINRIVLIKDADLMSLPAQNALLKTLEEPPAQTVIILSSSDESVLIPTLISRTTLIRNTPPMRAQLRQQFKEYSEAEFNKAYAISSNDLSLLEELLQDKSHPLYETAELTKDLLKNDRYFRLLQIDALSKDKDKTQRVLFLLERMALSAVSVNSNGSSKWREILQNSYDAKEAISKNAQAKLVLTNLLLNI